MVTAKQLFGVRDLDHDPARLGHYAVYRPNRPNPCPGCGQSQWIVGRVSAEQTVQQMPASRGTQLDAIGRYF